MQGQITAGRKRPAPGASPMTSQSAQPSQQMSSGLNFPQQSQGPTGLDDDSAFDWSNPNTYTDPSAATGGFDSSLYGSMNGLPQPANPNGSGSVGFAQGAPSNQLVRRNANTQLAPRNHGGLSAEPWDFGGTGAGMQTPGATWENSDDDEDLDQKALAAKKEAQAKRKQIPPFVQKLSSFLDESNNTELIRWSDDGNSFLVLDEDEFAKTLIPELFKHNNYASFVRQLNMYGFHKKVGLSDNSMRMSENKQKNPSEYYNRYFKRGRPELLWLIQKPKTAPSGPKRKRDDDKGKTQGDSDDENRKTGQDGGDSNAKANRSPSRDLTTVPRSEIAGLRKELQSIQQHQKFINTVLGQIRRQHDQLYQQAAAFQSLHDRHESSINAILTFLATFYNRSLEGNGNIADMFSIPQQQTHGNVVDVGDFTEADLNQQPQPFQRTGKRPRALLPAPDSVDGQNQSGLHPASVKSAFTPRSPNQRASSSYTQRHSQFNRIQEMDTANSSKVPSPEIRNDAPTPPGATASSTTENPDIMSVINNVNANNASSASVAGSPGLDFSAALNHFENADGKGPLTPEQRNDMLSLIAADNAAKNNSNGHSSAGGTTANQQLNALTSPTPPPVPTLDDLSAAKAQLEMVQKLQQEQANKVQDLADRLQPLSPSGTIPGLDANDAVGSGDGENDSYFNTGDFDYDSFVDNAAFLNGPSAAGDVDFNDIDFNLDGANDERGGQETDDSLGGGGGGGGSFGDSGVDAGSLGVDGFGERGGRVESLSSEATSPANTADEAHLDEIQSPSKRRRLE